MPPGGAGVDTLTALMRTTLAVLLAVVAVPLVQFADLGVWVEREVAGTTPFVRLGEQVLDRSAVRDALAERVVSALAGSAPGLAGREVVLRPVVARVLASPAVRPALDDVLASTHDQLRQGHDPLQLDVNPLLPAVRAQLPPTVASRIPPGLTLAPVTVLRRRDAPAVWEGVQVVQGAAVVVPILALVALAGALVAARRRGSVCIAIGAAATVLALGLVAVVKPGRSLLEQQTGTPTQRAAFLAGYDTVTRSFVQQTVVLAVIGALLAIVGLVVIWHRSRTVRPRGWA
jgi:hypothetical protein